MDSVQLAEYTQLLEAFLRHTNEADRLDAAGDTAMANKVRGWRDENEPRLDELKALRHAK